MKKRSIKYLLLIFLPFYCLSCFNSDFLPEPHSLSYDSASFNKLAADILSQDQVFEMDDFTRYYKVINNIHIKLDNKPVDTSEAALRGNEIYINRLIDSLKLDKKIIINLKKQLETTQLREFHRSHDSILFTVDGFLSHSWGFFYTRKPANVADTISFYFNDDYINHVARVNEHWRRVGY